MSHIKPYPCCATRLEYRSANPPSDQYIADIIEGIRRSGVEAVWHAVVGPLGSPLFASEVFPDHHPQADLGSLQRLAAAVHAEGRSVLSWYPLNAGGGVLASHPDWGVKFYEIEGTPSQPEQEKHYACPNSPYGELLPKFVAEVIERVGYDGIWFDGSTWSHHGTYPWFLPGCRCDWCRERFKSDLGLSLPEKVDYEDRVFKEWVRWRYDVLMRLWKDCVTAARTVRSDATIAFNNYRRRHGIDLGWNTGIPLRRLGWGCMMSSELDAFPHQVDFQIKLGRAFGCTLGAESWWALFDYGNVWVADHDPLPGTQAHLGAIGAGGGMSMGTDTNPTICAPILKAIQDQAGPRIGFNGGTTVEYAAIWCSQCHQDFGCREKPLQAWNQWHGANELGRHVHFQTSVVFDDHINAEDLKRYPVLLVGDSACVSREQAAAVEGYAASGGVVVACRNAGVRDQWGDRYDQPVLDELFGVRSRREGKGQATLEYPVGTDRWVTYQNAFVVAEPVDDVQVMARVIERVGDSWNFPPLAEGETLTPAGMWVRRVGKGFVVWAGVDLFGTYFQSPTPQVRRTLKAILFGIRQPAVTLDGPVCVTVNTRTDEDGEWMVHLHNCPGTAYSYPFFHGRVHSPGEVVPVHDLVVRLDGVKAVEARSGLDGKRYEIVAEGAGVAVPKVELHEVVCIKVL